MEENISLYIYDQTFKTVAVIDAYESLIWTDRYDQCGDFELTLPYMYGKEYFGDYLIKDNYCGIEYSKRKMIIERIEYENDEESAPIMIVSGRSIESLLDRRIVLTKTEFGDDETEVSVQTSIQSLLNSHIISPSNEDRKIDKFIFQASEDTAITSLNFSESYDGDDLYSIITGVVQDKKIGFKLIFNDNWEMVFSLYAGRNLTSTVIFSPYFDNLKNTNFFTSSEEYKNVMIISTGENSSVTVNERADYVPSGIERREVMIDQDELKENKETTLTNKQLQTKGRKKLKQEFKIKTGVEGEIVPNVLYEYGTDYEVGDKVQLTDIYGNTEAVYISEVVISCDESGLSIIPTFSEIEET